MDLKQRLLIYIQRLGVSVAEFERNAGLSILKSATSLTARDTCHCYPIFNQIILSVAAIGVYGVYDACDAGHGQGDKRQEEPPRLST